MKLFLIVFTAFVFFFSNAVLADNAACEEDVIQNQVQSLMVNVNQSQQGVTIARQVELGLEKGFVKPDRKEDMLRAAYEFYIRKKEQCYVPVSLSSRVSDALSIGASDGVSCQLGQFSKAVDRQFSTIKATGGYPAFEEVIKKQVSKLIVADAGEIFTAKWEADPKFREKSIKAGLEMGVMQMSGCSNPEAPILEVIATF